jgi:hypothetical protein
MLVAMFASIAILRGSPAIRRCVVKRKRIKSVLTVAAMAAAIVGERRLYSKMHQAGWRVRP